MTARSLSPRVKSRWKGAMAAPSNSAPRPVPIAVGRRASQTTLSQMFVAMEGEDARAQAVALLQQLVRDDGEGARAEELPDG